MIKISVELGYCIRFKAWAVHFRVKISTHCKHGITHHLALETQRGKAPKQTIVRINRSSLFIFLPSIHVGNASLRIGRTGNDQPMDCFDAVLLLLKFEGEKIKKIWVRGSAAIETKIARGIHNANTKMPLPKSIDHHPESKRVFWMREPLSE